MPANIERYNEQATFASRREPAWHGLGTVFQHDATVDEMLELSLLAGWDVEKIPVPFPAEFNSVRDYYMTVRNNPFAGKEGQRDVLGMVRGGYRVSQNEDTARLADSVLGGLGRWETAGSIRNGSVVFFSLAVDHEIVLDPTGVADKVNSYLLVTSSHDGSLATQATVTPVRVVCQNTLTMALAGADSTFKIRHTKNYEDKAREAAKALGLVNTFGDAFEAEAKALFEQAITDDTFNAIVKAAYPVPDADVKGALTKWQSKSDALWNLYNGETQNGIRGTAWGAYNALTERLDWFRAARKGDAESALIAASGFDPIANAEKNRLREVVKAVAFA